jgi:DNA-binding response OmpR family regulator
MKKVLICDDDDGIVDVAQIILQERGYTVQTLTQSGDIFDKVKSFDPNLILLDLWMPEMNGEEITRSLKANTNTQHIPIVIVSASRDTEKVARKVGADDFISKPFDIIELEEKVARNIEKGFSNNLTH